VSGECDSHQMLYNGHRESRVMTQEMVKKEGGVDIVCDAPSRQNEGVYTAYTLKIKYQGGKIQELDMNRRVDDWKKAPVGKWCMFDGYYVDVNDCKSHK